MKDVEVDTTLTLAPARSRIRYEPHGVALIFGSWNFPYFVTIGPLATAIASGNLAVIKPSEMAPASSAAIKKLVNNYLDKEAYDVIEGGPEVAVEIGKHHWDFICFTGSTQKGKLVAEVAARNMTPCVMELGGKCPVIIDATADVDYAARTVAFVRFFNAGQTCVATDYALVHESVK